MKSSKAEIHARFHKIPRLRFCEDRRLTSYSGMVVFQALFHAMRLRARIRACFHHLEETRIFGRASVVVLLIVHIILGFRRLRGLDYYRDVPLVARVCGVRRLPDVATNMTGDARDVLLFHNGRGSQEKLFGEAKQHAALDVIATRRKVGNQVFTLAGMLAHNLGRELQMATRPADRADLDKRPPRWEFESLGTIRHHLLHNAGTLTRPRGELTLTMNANDAVRAALDRYLDDLMDRTTDRAA